MCVFMYLCHASWPNEKRYRAEIRYIYSHRPYLKTIFCFFRKNDPQGRQPRKIAVSRGFSAYLLDCLVFHDFYPFFYLSLSPSRNAECDYISRLRHVYRMFETVCLFSAKQQYYSMHLKHINIRHSNPLLLLHIFILSSLFSTFNFIMAKNKPNINNIKELLALFSILYSCSLYII